MPIIRLPFLSTFMITLVLVGVHSDGSVNCSRENVWQTTTNKSAIVISCHVVETATMMQREIFRWWRFDELLGGCFHYFGSDTGRCYEYLSNSNFTLDTCGQRCYSLAIQFPISSYNLGEYYASVDDGNTILVTNLTGTQQDVISETTTETSTTRALKNPLSSTDLKTSQPKASFTRSVSNAGSSSVLYSASTSVVPELMSSTSEPYETVSNHTKAKSSFATTPSNADFSSFLYSTFTSTVTKVTLPTSEPSEIFTNHTNYQTIQEHGTNSYARIYSTILSALVLLLLISTCIYFTTKKLSKLRTNDSSLQMKTGHTISVVTDNEHHVVLRSQGETSYRRFDSLLTSDSLISTRLETWENPLSNFSHKVALPIIGFVLSSDW